MECARNVSAVRMLNPSAPVRRPRALVRDTKQTNFTAASINVQGTGFFAATNLFI